MSPKVWTRIIAVTICASGAVAAASLSISAGRFAPIRVLFPVAAIFPLIFWITVSGIGLWLWTGSPRSRIAASVLLASQIPVVVAGSAIYWWHTPAQVALIFQRVGGQTLLGVTTKLGPALSFWLGRPNQSTTLGINLVAVLCLYALLRSNKSLERSRER